MMKRHLIIEQAEIEERPEENRDDDDLAVQLLGILFQEAAAFANKEENHE